MTFPAAATDERVVRLVGVYDADSTLRGEVSYWVGARLGRRHCSLCDITHGSVRERSAWKACKAGLAVPFDTYHRNDQPDAVRTAADGRAPAVVAETITGTGTGRSTDGATRHRMLLGADELEACGASIDRLVEAIDTAVARLGLTWAST